MIHYLSGVVEKSVMSTRKTRKVKEYLGIKIRLSYWIVILTVMREDSLLKYTSPAKK